MSDPKFYDVPPWDLDGSKKSYLIRIEFWQEIESRILFFWDLGIEILIMTTHGHVRIGMSASDDMWWVVDHQKLAWKFGLRTSWVILSHMTHRKFIMDMRLGLKFYVMLRDLVGCSCPDVMKTWVLTTSQSKFWHGCWDPVKKSWWDVKKWGPDLKSLGSRSQSLMGPDVDF